MHVSGDDSLKRPRLGHPAQERHSGLPRQQALRHRASLAAARRWPDIISHAVHPGWVPTRMGGPSITDDLEQGHLTHLARRQRMDRARPSPSLDAQAVGRRDDSSALLNAGCRITWDECRGWDFGSSPWPHPRRDWTLGRTELRRRRAVGRAKRSHGAAAWSMASARALRQ